MNKKKADRLSSEKRRKRRARLPKNLCYVPLTLQKEG